MTGILGAATSYVIGTVSFSGGTVTHTPASAPANATLNFTSSGTITGNTTGQTWLPSGSAANYDVRATLSSGDTPSGTLGSWLNLGTTRSWVLTDNVNDGVGKNCDLLIEIRPTGGGATLDSATFSFMADIISI